MKQVRSPAVAAGAWAFGVVGVVTSLLLGLVPIGCKQGKTEGGAAPAPSASVAPSASAATSAAAAPPATSASVAQAPPPSEPVGSGVSSFVAAAQTEGCKAQSGDIATYLQRGEVTVAGSEGSLAAAWLIKLAANKPGAQLAFAGFALDAKQVARARGIGTANETAPRIFANGAGWTLVWFDENGLAYTKPRWETAPAPVIEHLSTVNAANADDVALAATPAGAIVAVAPFNMEKAQLGLFQFAPTDAAAPAVQALGATHHAHEPRRPAVAADGTGYTLAWHEGDGRIVVSRFDLAGKEIDEAYTLAAAPPAGAPARERVNLVATTKGAMAVWIEGDKILARAVDAAARPGEKTWLVGRGRAPALAPIGDGALVVFLGQEGGKDDQVLAVKLSESGEPSATGMRISDGTGAVKDAAAVTSAGPRLGFLWAEPMSNGVSTKRAILRTLESSCVP
ncbi:hypothetical protein [Polyangium fumosum]|uniref:Uncharacterized protein n=1 Tax=Polyangium fumosum TaxID=889272 RepID=A0A4U1J095_9BACT|nr:hypothetical protein [Polyangium fumosum]TKD00424.1 hypothetical protein E8A74_34590 [Polyangium fumosum]